MKAILGDGYTSHSFRQGLITEGYDTVENSFSTPKENIFRGSAT